MIGRWFRTLRRLAILGAVGYAVGRLVERARAASDTGRAPAEPWRPAIPDQPLKVQGDALLEPRGAEARADDSEPALATPSPAEKPPVTPRPAGSAAAEKKAPAAKKAQAPRSPAPPRGDDAKD